MKNIATRIGLYILSVIRAFAYIPVILLYIPIGYVVIVTLQKSGADTDTIMRYVFPPPGTYDISYLLTVYLVIALAVSLIVAMVQEAAGRKIFIERQRLTRALVSGAVFGWCLVAGLLYWQSLGDETFLYAAGAGLSAHLLCIYIARKLSRVTLSLHDAYHAKNAEGTVVIPKVLSQ